MHSMEILWIIAMMWTSTAAANVILSKHPRHFKQAMKRFGEAGPKPSPDNIRKSMPSISQDIQGVYGRYKSNCKTLDDFSPCACHTRTTMIAVHQDGRQVDVEFLEAACVMKENMRRIKAGEIESKYICYQIKEEVNITEDTDGNPVDVKVNRRNGCELRCIAKDCETIRKMMWLK